MTHFASRLASARVAGLVTLAAAGGGIALISGGAAEAATPAKAPTLAVSFTPAEIGVQEGSSITYTITNPNSSGSLYDVAFTDALPGNVVFDNPVNVTASGCGTPTDPATSGTAQYGAAGITVKAGTPCTITVSVTPVAPGDLSDTLGPLTYQTAQTGDAITAPTSNETTASLDVLAAPTATIATPKNHAVYTYGEKVKTSFACAAPSDANGPTLEDCMASDDLGNVYTDGQDLVTTTPGKHTLTVEADDTDGDSVNADVDYTVLADNIVSLKQATAAAAGGLKLTLGVPGAGTLKVTETHGATTVATKTVTVAAAKTALAVALAPNPVGRKLLTAAKDKLAVTLKITYTPKGGTVRSSVKTVTLR